MQILRVILKSNKRFFRWYGGEAGLIQLHPANCGIKPEPVFVFGQTQRPDAVAGRGDARQGHSAAKSFADDSGVWARVGNVVVNPLKTVELMAKHPVCHVVLLLTQVIQCKNADHNQDKAFHIFIPRGLTHRASLSLRKTLIGILYAFAQPCSTNNAASMV